MSAPITLNRVLTHNEAGRFMGVPEWYRGRAPFSVTTRADYADGQIQREWCVLDRSCQLIERHETQIEATDSRDELNTHAAALCMLGELEP